MGSEIVNASVLEVPLWQRYADQFPVRENLIYLNHAAVAPLPRRCADALKHLHAAYSSRNDPEIAAHLGEVLWKVGQHDEAQKIWRAALNENPNHESLITVMEKYRP